MQKQDEEDQAGYNMMVVGGAIAVVGVIMFVIYVYANHYGGWETIYGTNGGINFRIGFKDSFIVLVTGLIIWGIARIIMILDTIRMLFLAAIITIDKK